MDTLVLDQETTAVPKFIEPGKTVRIAVAMTFFMNGALIATWVSRIPAVQASRGLSHGSLGLALLAIALGAVFAMPLAGWCSLRFGSHRVTQLSAVLTCMALPWLALPTGFPLFVLLLFCFGAFHGALDVAMNAQAVAVEHLYRRSINSSFHALFSAGGLTGAAMGGVIAAAGIPPLAHFAGAAVLLGGSTAVLALPRLLQVFETQGTEISAEGDEPRKLGLRNPILVTLGAIAFCVMMGEGAMADWSAVFLRQVGGATEGLAAAGYAAFSITMAIGRFSGDSLTTRLGPGAIVRLSGALAAVGLTLAILTGQPTPALLGFAAVGAGFACVVPQVFTAAGRTPGIAPGVALATVTTLGYFGFLLGPPIIGFAAELIGLRGALGIVVVTSVLIVALSRTVRWEKVTSDE